MKKNKKVLAYNNLTLYIITDWSVYDQSTI